MKVSNDFTMGYSLARLIELDSRYTDLKERFVGKRFLGRSKIYKFHNDIKNNIEQIIKKATIE